MRIETYSISGLGHLSAMVVDDEAGVAVVVDPRRDVDLYLEQAAAQSVRIGAILETHLHNDYVSGARDLAALTGATQHIGVGAALEYEHRGLRDGEALEVAGLRFTTLDTPGHTPEHVAYTVDASTDGGVLATPSLFSGGSLLVGAVGRTDLLGADHAIPYAHAMYHSLHDRILPLGDDVTVHPTHGAGSLCSTGIGSMPSTTIGHERHADPLLAPMDIDAFARALLAGQPAIPTYFARMRPTNQRGPALLGGRVPVPPTLEPAALAADAGTQVVDARPARDHVAGHIPGSISIPVDESFGTWLGWVVDLDRPVAFVVSGPDDIEPLMRQAIRIGRDDVAGVLVGLDGWRAAGLPVEAGGRISLADLATALDHAGPDERPVLIDVRQADEYDAGHVRGAWHINAGSLGDRLADLPRDRPIATMCAAGFRASIAASILRAAGFERVDWVDRGFPAWAAAGYPVEAGSDRGRGPA